MTKDNKCSIDDCPFEKHNEYEECILHCSKEKMSSMHHPYFIEPEKFYNHLSAYIVNTVFEYKEETSLLNRKTLKEYIQDERATSTNREGNKRLLEKSKITFGHISFPNTDNRERYQYLRLLNKLKNICFNYCSFYISSIDLKDIECFFQDCHFYVHWHMFDYKASQEKDNLEIYNACVFHNSVTASCGDKAQYTLNYIQFNGCTFNKNLSFENIDAKMPIFNDWDEFESKIECLKVHESNFSDRFVLDNYSIREVDFKNSIFNSKFEFINNRTDSFEVNNCNFEKLAEFYNSKFDKFEIFKSIFNEYTGFEKCDFGSDIEVTNKEYLAKYTYVTFLNFINFRNTNFKSGISLEDTNMKDSPNFLNASVASENTSRETFRLIKNSFDKIGNHIEANKFFSLEMRKYKKDLSNVKGHKEEKFIFWFNGLVSNFGQSYWKPFGWLMLFAFLYLLILCAYDCRILQEGFVMSILNAFASSILPFKKFLPDKLEFITLIFMIIQSMLIWHIAVAVKRHTKR